ncbi:MAG: YbjN domain-containing protein [Vicinamibacterales bacterium]
MPTTFDEIEALLTELGLRFDVHRGNFRLSFETQQFRDPAGRHLLTMLIGVAGEGRHVRLICPYVLTAGGPHRDALVRACLMVQWSEGLVRFAFDERDGEIRAAIDVPLEDASLTARQLDHCIRYLAYAVDRYYPALVRAAADGIIGLAPMPGAVEIAAQVVVDELTGSGDPADAALAETVRRQLEPPADSGGA